MMKHQRGAVRTVMDMSLFVLLLLSGLLCSTSGLWREYSYINQNMSWSEAQSYCRESFTDLATVDSMNDLNRMINLVNDGYNGSVWIGLKRATQSRWGWSNGDDSLAQYSSWDSVNASSQGDCAFSLNRTWFKAPCSTKMIFLCVKNTTQAGVFTIKNWTDAQSYCRKSYSDMFTGKNTFKESSLYAAEKMWIGLFLDSWQWSDQWSRFFRNWDAGYPSNSSGSGDCVAVSKTASGKWAHDSCDLKYPFICHGRPKPLYRHYYYINERMSWTEAQSYCRERFTDLATLDSIDDVNMMINKVNDGYSGSVWIGLKRATQIRWAWSMENNTLSQYTNWKSGEPNFDGECVASLGGRWFDTTCSTLLPFVCYNDTAGFKLIDTPMTWRDAQSYCRQYHIDLASVSSLTQQRLINDSSSVWIGLFLHSWQWSDQWDLHFRYWTTGLPSNSSGSDDCVAMSTTDSGKWAHDSCDLQRPFICYKDIVKRQVIRLNLSCDEKCDLNDPSLQSATMNKINEKMKSLGLESYNIIWRKDEGGKMVHTKINPTTKSNIKCDDGN